MNRMLIERADLRMPPSSSRRADAKARTRRKVLDAARDLFMERGYEAATIRDIAARAALSTGAVFANFSDKGDLFDAVLAEDMEQQIDLVKAAQSGDMPMEQAVLELFRCGYQFNLARLPLLQAATGLSWSQGLNGPLGHRPAFSLALTAMGEVLARGRARGELSPAADSALIAEMLWDAYLANYRRALFDGWNLEQLMARTERQVRVLLAGASAAPA
jgi:AcrR family transcriptional regulator